METPEQIADLMKLLEGQTERNSIRDVAMVALILGSGMRASELCSLNMSDLNGIRDGVVTIRRKGGNVENVYIADFAYNYVLRYVVMRGKTSPDEPLFLSQKGNRMNRNTLWKSLASKQRLIEQHTGIHRFRHAFISDVEHNQKGGAALARDLGGHKSVRITNKFNRPSSDAGSVAKRQRFVIGYLLQVENQYKRVKNSAASGFQSLTHLLFLLYNM